MTLLVTEIHNHNEPDDVRIVFAADRRITRNGSYADTRKKIFEIPGLNAGIGYFGLAEIGSGSSAQPMNEWVGQQLRQNTTVSTLAEFSNVLADRLNSAVPLLHRQSVPSGFHIAGFDGSGRVEFWFVRNVKDDRTTCTGTYSAREDFQRRDKASLQSGQHQSYRNGDLLPHVLLWETLDRALEPLLNRADMLIRLTPESQLDDPGRYGAAGLSKDHARVSRSIVLTRGLPGLLGTVSLA